MRKFYLTYQDRTPQISQTASGNSFQPNQKSQTGSGKLIKKGNTPSLLRKSPFQLSWSQYVFLISINNPDERRFYEIESAGGGWTLTELKRQFNSGLYECLALSRDKEEVRKLAIEGQRISRPEDLLKEPYVLEFLGLDEKSSYSESDLESGIIGKIEQFLLELGKGFLFEARQKRFTFDEEHFFVDLVLYRHCMPTIPKQLRQVFYDNRHDGELLSRIMRGGYECLEDVVSTVKRVDLKIGTIMLFRPMVVQVDIIRTCV